MLSHRSGEHIHKNTKQLRKCPREAFSRFSGEDIAAFVSKQNNKTSQPVVVNFLFASIDSISRFPPRRWQPAYSTGESRKIRQEEIEEGSKDRDRELVAQKLLRTFTKNKKRWRMEFIETAVGVFVFFSRDLALAWQSAPAVDMDIKNALTDAQISDIDL